MLRRVLAGGPLARSAIGQATGLSLAAVSRQLWVRAATSAVTPSLRTAARG
ncbi:hypothetical protein ACIGXM_24635 [Kitasatospora sp. NPDC052896]|uniref:hypothetical protein n=1 Tax=Kitasatospora sp. NPDC052896 TaxID=3364061 RepID=UPI0037C94609